MMVPPFDHPDIIEGQATVAAEMLAQLPDGNVPDLVIIPVAAVDCPLASPDILTERWRRTASSSANRTERRA